METLTDKFSRIAALKPTRPLAPRTPALRAPSEDEPFAHLLGAGIGSNRYGEHALIRNWFSTPELTEPAAVTLDLLSRARDETLSRRTRTALADPTKWLFLDTETTGITGGAGTYAFLVGVAWWDAGGLQVEQFFMRDFADEHSILHELAARLAERPVLISFNGKTFDWPLLENRFVMTRSILVPRLAAHLDLLHPARALWKLRLGCVRLVELERRVMDPVRLGWRREDDISPTQIPQHYFDYLRGGPVAPMAAVLRHNQLDLRGLAALLGKIDSLVAARNASQEGVECLDLFGLSRFLQRRGESERAYSTCAQALGMGLPGEFIGMARRDLALLSKRRGDHESAAQLWLALANDEQNGIQACEQLAIYFERRAKDLQRALEFTQLALSKLRRLRLPSRDPLAAARALRCERSMQKRLARLQRRTIASQFQPPSAAPRLLV